MLWPLWKQTWPSLQRYNTTSIWPSHSTTRELKAYIPTKTCTEMLILAFFFELSRDWKQLNYSSIGEWIHELLHPYNDVLPSHEKNEPLIHATSGNNLNMPVWSERTQTKAVHILFMIPFMQNCKKTQTSLE